MRVTPTFPFHIGPVGNRCLSRICSSPAPRPRSTRSRRGVRLSCRRVGEKGRDGRKKLYVFSAIRTPLNGFWVNGWGGGGREKTELGEITPENKRLSFGKVRRAKVSRAARARPPGRVFKFAPRICFSKSPRAFLIRSRTSRPRSGSHYGTSAAPRRGF